LVFVDVSEDSIMVDDVVMPSNPPIAPIEKEELKETSLDVNVSQRSCNEKLFERVVCIQVDRLAWDRGLFLNPHALAIYLKFVIVREVVLKRFEECQSEDDVVRFHCQT